MSFAEVLGTIGVSMLLVGFFLNLFGLMRRSSFKYVLLNLFGGGLACTASVLIEFFPFVISGRHLDSGCSCGSREAPSGPVPGGSGLSFEPRCYIDREPSSGE